MAGRNILITGGAGFIGSHVVRLFVNKYPEYRIICLDKLTYAGNLANLKDLEGRENYKFVRMDICDFEGVYQLMQDERIDGIIHLAAESHVDRSIKDPFTFAQTNVMGTLSLLQAAKLYWEQFHYVIPIRPADHLLQNDLPPSALVVVSDECASGGCAQRAALFGSDGRAKRSGDYFEAKALQQNLYGIYHFSNEGVCSWYDFAKTIAEYAGHTDCDIQPCHSDEFPSKVTRPAYSVLDKTKIKETFGVKIPYWTDSLKKCIANLQ